MFTAEQVWGLAVAADRINGGYIKEDEWLPNAVPPCRGREANKKMVKDWLRTGAFSEATAEDIAEGQRVRHYFNGFLLREISGKLNDFDRQALKIAQMDEFTSRNMLEFAIIACLPSAMRRDQAKQDVTREIRLSTQLAGEVGDKVQGEIEVLQCSHSPAYNKFRIRAKMVDSFVDFWYNTSMEAGTKISIRARIKAQRGDNTTQLNFVKRG